MICTTRIVLSIIGYTICTCAILLADEKYTDKPIDKETEHVPMC